MLKKFYLFCIIFGTIIPWIPFGNYFITEGVILSHFVSSATANGVSTAMSLDLIFTMITLCVWAYVDSRQHEVKLWWLVIPAVIAVGPSLGLPLYLYLRHDHIS